MQSKFKNSKYGLDTYRNMKTLFVEQLDKDVDVGGIYSFPRNIKPLRTWTSTLHRCAYSYYCRQFD